MKGDDDEDDQNVSIGVSRYPCMPSLVALQQMRNRLHLAHLGRKLMKWTAMATGREQRKVATDLNDVYDDFPKDIRHAFILLARCRYFYPHINTMVVESVGDKAGITIGTTTKSVSGVRVMQYELIESNHDPYAHLGLEKGGQLILETKEAWRNMLKRMIKMLQLRNSFLMLDLAHRAATKKMNVLAKIVIPRTNISIQYILSELEEKEREEFFRMKKILQCKEKLKVKKKDKNPTLPLKKFRCVVCGAFFDSKSQFTQSKEEIKLREFENQIKDVIDMTKIVEEQKLVLESMEDFRKMAENVKDQLESRIINGICDKCKKKREAEPDLPTEKLKEYSDDNITLKSVKTNIDEELGTFETEIDVITKVVRFRNEEGEICEDKKVVTIKREVYNSSKEPGAENDQMSSTHNSSNNNSNVSNTSNPSNPFENNKTVGIVNFENEIKRDIVRIKPTRRISQSHSILSTNFKELNDSNISLFNKSEILDIISSNLDIIDDKQSLNIDFEQNLFTKTNIDVLKQMEDNLFCNIPSTSAESAFDTPSFYKYLKEHWLCFSSNSHRDRSVDNEVRIDIKKDLEKSISNVEKPLSNINNNSDSTDDEC